VSVTRGCYLVRHEERRKLGKKKYASLDKTYKLIAKIEVINVTFTTVILSLSLSSSLLSLFLFLLCNKKYETLSHRPLANIQIKDVLTSPRLVRWRIQRLCQCSLLTPRRRWTLALFRTSPSRHILKLSQPHSRLIRTYTRKTPTRE